MAEDRQALTVAHADAAAVLARWVADQMAHVWPALNPDRLDETSGPWVRLAAQVIRAGRELAAMLSGTWHAADRAVAFGLPDADAAVDQFGAACAELATRTRRPVPATAAPYARRAARADTPSPADLFPAPPIDPAELRASLVITGPVTVKRTQDPRRAARRATAAAQRHALNGGRELVAESIRADRRAVGWLRVPNAGACAFCLMLASRGPVFKSETAATYTSKGGKADPYHDGCHCHPRAVYSRDEEWPDANRHASELWNKSTKGVRGGKYARNAFRHAVESPSE
jgi:hypothetical protein